MNTAKKRILLIDDDEMGNRVHQLLLQQHGYEVDWVLTGTDGIASVQTGNYDAVVLDLILPDVDGSEVLRAVKDLCPPLPVIVLSGAIEVEESVRRDADSVIVKGTGVNQFIAAL